MATWKDVISNPEFEKETPEQKQAIRDRFFEKVIRPQAEQNGDDINEVQSRFFDKYNYSAPVEVDENQASTEDWSPIAYPGNQVAYPEEQQVPTSQDIQAGYEGAMKTLTPVEGSTVYTAPVPETLWGRLTNEDYLNRSVAAQNAPKEDPTIKSVQEMVKNEAIKLLDAEAAKGNDMSWDEAVNKVNAEMRGDAAQFAFDLGTAAIALPTSSAGILANALRSAGVGAAIGGTGRAVGNVASNVQYGPEGYEIGGGRELTDGVGEHALYGALGGAAIPVIGGAAKAGKKTAEWGMEKGADLLKRYADDVSTSIPPRVETPSKSFAQSARELAEANRTGADLQSVETNSFMDEVKRKTGTMADYLSNRLREVGQASREMGVPDKAVRDIQLAGTRSRGLRNEIDAKQEILQDKYQQEMLELAARRGQKSEEVFQAEMADLDNNFIDNMARLEESRAAAIAAEEAEYLSRVNQQTSRTRENLRRGRKEMIEKLRAEREHKIAAMEEVPEEVLAPRMTDEEYLTAKQMIEDERAVNALISKANEKSLKRTPTPEYLEEKRGIEASIEAYKKKFPEWKETDGFIVQSKANLKELRAREKAAKDKKAEQLKESLPKTVDDSVFDQRLAELEGKYKGTPTKREDFGEMEKAYKADVAEYEKAITLAVSRHERKFNKLEKEARDQYYAEKPDKYNFSPEVEARYKARKDSIEKQRVKEREELLQYIDEARANFDAKHKDYKAMVSSGDTAKSIKPTTAISDDIAEIDARIAELESADDLSDVLGSIGRVERKPVDLTPFDEEEAALLRSLEEGRAAARENRRLSLEQESADYRLNKEDATSKYKSESEGVYDALSEVEVLPGIKMKDVDAARSKMAGISRINEEGGLMGLYHAGSQLESRELAKLLEEARTPVTKSAASLSKKGAAGKWVAEATGMRTPGIEDIRKEAVKVAVDKAADEIPQALKSVLPKSGEGTGASRRAIALVQERVDALKKGDLEKVKVLEKEIQDSMGRWKIEGMKPSDVTKIRDANREITSLADSKSSVDSKEATKPMKWTGWGGAAGGVALDVLLGTPGFSTIAKAALGKIAQEGYKGGMRKWLNLSAKQRFDEVNKAFSGQLKWDEDVAALLDSGISYESAAKFISAKQMAEEAEM